MADTDSNGVGVGGVRVATNTAGLPSASGAVGGLPTGEVQKRVRRPRGSQFQHNYGTAKVKAYPIFGSELWELGGISAISSIAFSVAWSCFSFSVDTSKDVALSTGADKAVLELWRSYTTNANWVGGCALLIGMGLLIFGGLKIKGIMSRTHFDED